MKLYVDTASKQVTVTKDPTEKVEQNGRQKTERGTGRPMRTDNRAELISDLARCGHLCAATGHYAEAVTVWAAHAALLQRKRFHDWPAEARLLQESLRNAQRALGPDRAQAASARGAAMSPDTAGEYALMLTDPNPQPPIKVPDSGRLSARERELVTLVAHGRTNAQIAAQLYISVRTVTSHLDRIRDKTGCRRRADLTRLALTMGLV